MVREEGAGVGSGVGEARLVLPRCGGGNGPKPRSVPPSPKPCLRIHQQHASEKCEASLVSSQLTSPCYSPMCMREAEHNQHMSAMSSSSRPTVYRFRMLHDGLARDLDQTASHGN